MSKNGNTTGCVADTDKETVGRDRDGSEFVRYVLPTNAYTQWLRPNLKSLPFKSKHHLFWHVFSDICTLTVWSSLTVARLQSGTLVIACTGCVCPGTTPTYNDFFLPYGVKLLFFKKYTQHPEHWKRKILPGRSNGYITQPGCQIQWTRPLNRRKKTPRWAVDHWRRTRSSEWPTDGHEGRPLVSMVTTHTIWSSRPNILFLPEKISNQYISFQV